MQNMYSGGSCQICKPSNNRKDGIEIEFIIYNLLISFREMLIQQQKIKTDVYEFHVIDPQRFLNKLFQYFNLSKSTKQCSHQLLLNSFIKELSINQEKLKRLFNLKNAQRSKLHFHFEIISQQVKSLKRFFPFNKNAKKIQKKQDSPISKISSFQRFRPLMEEEPRLQARPSIQMINEQDEERHHDDDFPPKGPILHSYHPHGLEYVPYPNPYLYDFPYNYYPMPTQPYMPQHNIVLNQYFPNQGQMIQNQVEVPDPVPKIQNTKKQQEQED